MNLSEHFTFEEMTFSETALRHGIDNIPWSDEKLQLSKLCNDILEPARGLLGIVRVLSGYRSPTVNRLVGGVSGSQHCLGQAADIVINGKSVDEVVQTIMASAIPFDQMIHEFDSWTHISRSDTPRKEVLRAFYVNGQKTYIPYRP